MFHSALQTGDDVLYYTAASAEPCCGRILTVTDSSYSITKYEFYDDLPLPPEFCLDFREVRLTSSTCSILKASVVDIIFVLTTSEIENRILSISGMSNVYFIRFRVLDSGITTPLPVWISFQVRNYRLELFSSLIRIQEAIVRMLNNRRISQRTHCTVGKIFVPWDAFNYIKTKTSMTHQSFSYRQRIGKRVERKISSCMRKESVRRRVSIHEIKSLDSESIGVLKDLFGSIIEYGSRTGHPRVGIENGVHVHDDTVLNVLDGIKLVYVVDYEEITIRVSYRRVVSRDYSND